MPVTYKNLLRFVSFLILTCLHITSLSAQRRIDSISIVKNWRTKDKIILRELMFQKGDCPDSLLYEQSKKKLWNLGNLAEVKFRSDTLANGNLHLEITARDAFTLVPILAYSGNKEEFNLTLGVNDNNFLGRNIGLDLVGSTGTNKVSYNLGVRIPRQLLYKNMTLGFSSSVGENVYTTYNNREAVAHLGVKQKNIGFSIGNPYHTDFSYSFSPNLGISVFSHQTDTSIVDQTLLIRQEYEIAYLSFSLSESIGIINRFRHQKDGYLFDMGASAGMGLNNQSTFYYTISGGAQYHKLFNQVVQLSLQYKTGFTSSDFLSLQHHLGASDIKGILYGQVAGKAYYTGYLGGHFTYINKKWFAIEHSLFMNIGNATNHYGNLYTSNPVMAVGTGVEFRIPMIPWLYLRFHFTYAGKGSNWFNMEF